MALSVDLSVDEIIARHEARLALARKAKKRGARKALRSIQEARTRDLDAEINGGKIHVKPHLRSAHRPDSQADMGAM